MELDQLKAEWAKEQKSLEARLLINEKRVHELTLEKSKSSFSKLLDLSIMGRNMALIYMTISFFGAWNVLNAHEYSIPALLGGLAMLFSFFQHYALKKPDFEKMTSVELQKSILQFKNHTSQFAKYDIVIVAIWFITIAPVFFKTILNVSIYTNTIYTISFVILVVLLLVFMYYSSGKIYDKIYKDLETNNISLEEIKAFEEA